MFKTGIISIENWNIPNIEGFNAKLLMHAKHGDQNLGFLTSQFLLPVSLASQIWKLCLTHRNCQELKYVVRMRWRISMVFVMTHQ